MLQNERPQIHISVRTLVEFVIRKGDIDDRVGGGNPMSAMQRGAQLHRKIQKRMGPSYHAEVPLKFLIAYDDYDLALEGRADGVIMNEGLADAEDGDARSAYMIDEIKGVYLDVEAMSEPNEVHLAQAKCYAYIVMAQNDLEDIDVQMTYVNLDTEEIRRFVEHQTKADLTEWFFHLIALYKRWADLSFYWRITRENAALALSFPYTYRPGQEKLCRDVYLSLKRRKTLFIQAPTGTGKTISTVFPAVKAMGDGMVERIFYLTAKTITRKVARDTIALLTENGLACKTVILTAKDKICPLEERKCNPDDCPYAKGHFDRINDAVYDLLTKDEDASSYMQMSGDEGSLNEDAINIPEEESFCRNIFDRDRIIAHANERMVCPFELSLDLASWCDVIVGDYNYVFDPNVYLKRFFAEGVREDYAFLVDEAHNLIERARQMYSATLVKERFLTIKKYFTTYNGGIPKALSNCNKQMLEWKKACDSVLILEDIDHFGFALSRLASAMEKFFEKHIELAHMDEIRELYFDVRNFLNIMESLDDNYRIYCDFMENGSFFIRLLCADPSYQLQQRLYFARSAVFFSATLLPVNYYKSLLCREEEPYAVYANSVFDEKKRFIAIGNDVTSRYKRRGSDEYDRFASYVLDFTKAKKGNYMIFGPSYRFLKEVYTRVEDRVKAQADADIRLLLQEQAMDEEARERFLDRFEETGDHTLLGFCVMGGVFSEGIDLTGERLIGAVILGVGLPMVTNERMLLSDFFDERDGNGFSYAYLYPGMNKVLQAAGRVIRTTEDVGAIALLDERFLYPDYKRIFPREWSDIKVCRVNDVGAKVRAFWEKWD